MVRFMILIKADKNSEAGVLPDEKLLTEMGKYNEELVKAGVMLAGEGLHPSSKGARVKFSGGTPVITDGPFAEAKEALGGYYLVEASDLDEALKVAQQAPAPFGGVEVRPVRTFD